MLYCFRLDKYDIFEENYIETDEFYFFRWTCDWLNILYAEARIKLIFQIREIITVV